MRLFSLWRMRHLALAEQIRANTWKLIHLSSTSREYFLINFKPKGSHCKLQNYIYLLPYKNCGIPYIAERITPVDRRINIQGKKVAKLLLPIIWIFAKMQHFKFYSLRWLSIIWMFAKMQHFKFYSLRWYQEMIMKMK